MSGDAINRAKLYLITPAVPGAHELESFLGQVLEGGVDVVQLREKQPRSHKELMAASDVCRKKTSEAGALFIVNDYPDVAKDSGADGVHLGQGDLPVAEARFLLGQEAVIGLSTHTESQVLDTRGADYIGVGPVFETPTKPGRAAVGLDLVRHAAASAPVPWFAIGGISLDSLPGVLEAGARRVAVVRALTEAPSPGDAARRMRVLLDRSM